jgi:hypothetical protein
MGLETKHFERCCAAGVKNLLPIGRGWACLVVFGLHFGPQSSLNAQSEIEMAARHRVGEAE